MRRATALATTLLLLIAVAGGISIKTTESVLHTRCEETGNETVSATQFNVTWDGEPVRAVDCDALDTCTYPEPEFDAHPLRPGRTRPSPLPVIGAVVALLGIGLIAWRGR